MKRFFNMIPGPDGCCILLYGDIDYGDIRSADIVREIIEAEAAYKKIDVRINSHGGDVYAGIAIFNTFRNTKANITIYVDGIAASMASVIALCGKPVYMSKYARLMLHSVQGGCYGNKSEILECIKELETLENTLCSMYAEKTGKTEEEIRAAYFDEKDHWLTADQALELGFIDGVYDADPIPEDSTPAQIYNIYQNKLNDKSNESEMIEKLKKRARFANCATEEDVLKHVDDLEKEAAKVPGLETTNATLKTENDAYKAAEVAAQEAEIDGMVETAFQEQRITEPEKAHFKAILKADRTNGEAILKARPAKKRIMDNFHKEDPNAPSPWDARMEEIRKNNNN